MALKPAVSSSAFLFISLALFCSFQVSTCQVLDAKVTCLDCPSHFDFSGIIVEARCDLMKKPITATTEQDGSFKLKLPPGPTKPSNCLAKLLGGRQQLYASAQSSVSKLIMSRPNSFTLSRPLGFAVSCPSVLRTQGKCGPSEAAAAKTINLPIPPEWGLAPTSYYVPIVPIVTGIP